MRSILILTVILLIFSCKPDKDLERRVNALERRVTSLEQQAETHGNDLSKNPVNSTATGTGENQKTPEFQFAETDFNFGTINEGEIVDHNFKFKNTGSAPLIISRASASCGCTVPSPPKDPIQPGQTSEIHVRFNSSNKQNQQVKTITIEANTNPVITKLQIHGFVVPKNQSGSTN
jgi:hypothetical protein